MFKHPHFFWIPMDMAVLKMALSVSVWVGLVLPNPHPVRGGIVPLSTGTLINVRYRTLPNTSGPDGALRGDSRGHHAALGGSLA